MRKNQNLSAFIALGCVIRGDTPHFEYVCRAVTDGMAALNLLPVPVIFGVLTVDNIEQARKESEAYMVIKEKKRLMRHENDFFFQVSYNHYSY